MKTSEIIKHMHKYCDFVNSNLTNEDGEYIVKETDEEISVIKATSLLAFPIVFVSKSKLYRWSIEVDPEFVGFDQDKVSDIVDCLKVYAATPLEERKDEKRWYIHLCEDEDEYLNLNKKQGVYDINNQAQTIHHKTKFTRSEIEEWAGTNSDEIIDWIIGKFGEEVE